MLKRQDCLTALDFYESAAEEGKSDCDSCQSPDVQRTSRSFPAHQADSPFLSLTHACPTSLAVFSAPMLLPPRPALSPTEPSSAPPPLLRGVRPSAKSSNTTPTTRPAIRTSTPSVSVGYTTSAPSTR